MYQILESKSSSTINGILLTAAATFAHGYSALPSENIKIPESKIEQESFSQPYDSFIKRSLQPSGYSSEYIFRSHPDNELISSAIHQIQTLSFLQVDDKADQAIDSYFAQKYSQKSKKIIYKRQA